MKFAPFLRMVLITVGGLTVAITALVIFLLVAEPTVLYRMATRVVVVDDSLERSDFIFVLNGRIRSRADHAARVYHEGWAPQVFLAHTREVSHRPDRPLSDLIAGQIVARGVPEDAVDIIPFSAGVVDTRDEARALRQYLERHPAERIIVVTTDHHTGRARRPFGKNSGAPEWELYMAAAPNDDRVTPDNWWKSDEGLRAYSAEFAKNVGVIFRLSRAR